LTKPPKKKLVARQSGSDIDWRPLVGAQTTLERVRNLIAMDHLPPVLLFYGRAGIGKGLLASAVAAMHYCETGVGCGSCSECFLIREAQHPEVLWIDSKGAALHVSEAERVLEHLAMVPQSRSTATGRVMRPVRLVVIADIDLFNEHGINRLLKTLEESPENVQIILTTSRLFGILPTLLSRCIKWHVEPPTVEESLTLLKKLCDPVILAEYSDEEMRVLLKRGGLSPGKALTAMDPQKKNQEFHEICRNLVHPEKIFAAIESAEWVASSKPSADAVVNEVELAINQSYRQEFLLGRNHHFTYQYLQNRRRLLREAKHFAGRRRIVLNAQLFAEAVGLTQVGINED
jgi:hypothetical protein